MADEHTTLMDHVTFAGHSASEVADLCDLLAQSADRGELNYTETAAIARRASGCIRFMLERVP